MSESKEPYIAPPAMTDEEALAYTQGKRRQLIDTVTADGWPEEKGDRMVLLAALDGMDRQSINKMRIGSQERQGAEDRKVQLAIAALTNPDNGHVLPHQRVIEGTARRVVPELDETDLPPLELAPGEIEVGIANRGYDQFKKDVGDDT